MCNAALEFIGMAEIEFRHSHSIAGAAVRPSVIDP